MQGNIDMNGHKVLNATLQVVDSLPLKAHDGQQVVYKGVVYTFIDGVWLSEASDLIGHTGETHEENFVYQPTAGDLSVKDGVAEIKKIKGNTLVWNQLNKKAATTSNKGIYIVANSDNTFTLSGTATESTQIFNTPAHNAEYKPLPYGHKGLFKLQLISGVMPSGCRGFYGNVYLSPNKSIIAEDNTNYRYLLFIIDAGTVIDNATLSFQVFDLTQMFGEGNEPSTVEEFEAMFPNDYYEYNEGTLISHDSVGVKTVGFNQWDGNFSLEKGYYNSEGKFIGTDNFNVTSFVKVLPNTEYHISKCKGSQPSLCFYDWNKQFIGAIGHSGATSLTFTTPNKCRYIRESVGIDLVDICINLSHTGYRNGEYQPYEEHTTQWYNGKKISELTSNGEMIFPDGLRSAGTVYDEITSDGKAIKRIGSVDMGTLNWLYTGSRYYVQIPQLADKYAYNSKSNIVTIKHITKSAQSSLLENLDKTIFEYPDKISKQINIIDTNYTDIDSFKASLQGQTLYYELAEPIVYTLDEPINTSYEAYDFGTEEILYSDIPTPQIPMKADISYGFNAVDMIRNNFEEIRSLKDRVTALEVAIQQMQNNNTDE